MKRTWTDDERQEIISMHHEGRTYLEIAWAYRVGRSAIAGVIYRQKNPDSATYRPRSIDRDEADPRKSVPQHGFKPITPSKYPFASDHTCPDFAWDDDHCAAVMQYGGFTALVFKQRGQAA